MEHSSFQSEVPSSSLFQSEAAAPQAREGIHEIGPPPFLTKTFDVMDDPTTNHVVSCSRGGTSFVVWDLQTFSKTLLPKYFKHNNFSSFVRQLNTYGFRKIDPEKWEFANEGFIKGHKHLLKTIRRRKPPSHQPIIPSQLGHDYGDHSLELGQFSLYREIDRLRHVNQRVRSIEQGESSNINSTRVNKVEPLEFGVSELEVLAMEMQGFGRGNRGNLEHEERLEREIDEGFWEELMLNEKFEGK
ncbi:hypothetical protein PIB30_007730 [Stylosanthes scabra]|uniref:HSF-type DNA-binding domain-containing protein n=1 Tax=Stylosanthes scabra TaxID=79078 RepID=A0ABU6Y2N2_9FABA|nr:hypothetical protein [Stylosanthes scabra]